MKLKFLAGAAAAALLLCGLPAISGCAQETYIEYTLYSSSGEELRTDNFAEDPSAPSEDGEGAASSAPEAAPEGAYYMITGYSGSPVNLVVPAEVNGTEVRGVGEQAFIQCRSLKSVVIEEGVQTTGGAAFAFCVNIATVSLPSTLDTSFSTFADCTSLESVEIAEGVTAIGDRDFYGCAALAQINADESSDINLPSTLTAIEPYAFYDCDALTGELVIPAGVTEITAISFGSCEGIEKVTFLGDITEVGYAAFGGCAALTDITLPDTVTSIGDGAFSYCLSLKSLTLPASITFVGASAFEGSAVTSVAVPAGKGVFLYTEELPSDDPQTEEDESVLPGSDEAEDKLFEFYYSEDVENDPSAKGRIPSYELTDAEKVAAWFKATLMEAYWYFVAV